MKTVKKTLFNKNSIVVEEYNNEKHVNHYVLEKIDQLQLNNRFIFYNPYNNDDKYITKTVEETKESPLGFYYKVKTIHRELKTKYKDNNYKYNSTAILYKTYTIFGPNYRYIIKYPWSYNGVNIGIDNRPYDIVSKSGIEDHFIYDLKEVLDTIFEICKNDKISYKSEYYKRYSSEINLDDKLIPIQITDIKMNIYLDIFGFKNGPIQQLNNDKILSHGFDLKNSFRNRKEK